MDFKQPYNSNEFVNFLSTFLPDDFEKTEENIELNDLSFNPDRIKNVKLIGSVSALENLCIYEIYHESENDPRITLSRETFRLMSNYGVKKALCAFISRNSPNYRFSLATIDLKLEGARITREYSNPRRYSFYLGPEAKVHTPTEFLINKGKIKDLKDLQNRFSVEVVTKTFFSELSNWYFWALKHVVFPKDAEKEENGRNIAVIRLITRLIFIWFMKQKGLMPDYLFNEHEIKNILKDILPAESTYYKTILQNLFFASLNTPQNERRFRTEKRFYKGFNPDFGDNSIYRYQSYFREPENIIDYFKEIPFLNGGLFECLDRKEENIYIDGFTDIKKNQPIVPNFLFFSKEKEIDLNKDYGTKEKRFKVRGLLDLLQLYNFTIDESTPIDVEIALDPELLGRVFENLLASYNPETATTARKATGSYYTPRAIVDYMVAQSLKEYFKTHLTNVADIDSKIDDILSYDSEENPFSDEETNTLINAVNKLKIIDPAVGSGAFPMGVLHKLVLVLSKLDPHNEKWKQQQISAIEKNITDVTLKKELIEKVELNFQKNELDYGRKLYLIQNCIYGVDIQPIATQIAKLRFFISLLVDEKIDKSQDTYDIEPLPNLETKFVTANSLIGLESQEILRSHDIINLENELRRVRDIYFSTSDTKKKEMLRKKDREIREKLAVLLKKSGFPSENTEKIAGWDPYDSNKSAAWFDPEWMFGVKEGFDVVIANPPYIHIRTKTFDRRYIETFKKNYELAKGQFDFFVIFTEKSYYLLKKQGVYSYIIPKRVLSNQNYEPIRLFYCNSMPVVSYLDAKRPFESANVEVNVITAKKGINTMQVSLYNYDPSGVIKFKDFIEADLITHMPFNIFPFSLSERIVKLLLKIKDNYDTLKNYMTITRGYEFGFNHNSISDIKTDTKIIKGDSVYRYCISFKNKYLDKSKLKSKDIKDPSVFKIPKLITKFVSNDLTFAYDNIGYHNTNVVYNCVQTSNSVLIKYLLSLLNSNCLNFWFKFSFLNEDELFPHIQKNQLEEIPIKVINVDKQTSFIKLVDQILSVTKDDDYHHNPTKQTKVKRYQHQIDQLVYRLYDLTEEEIKIVEGHNR